MGILDKKPRKPRVLRCRHTLCAECFKAAPNASRLRGIASASIAAAAVFVSTAGERAIARIAAAAAFASTAGERGSARIAGAVVFVSTAGESAGARIVGAAAFDIILCERASFLFRGGRRRREGARGLIAISVVTVHPCISTSTNNHRLLHLQLSAITSRNFRILKIHTLK